MCVNATRFNLYFHNYYHLTIVDGIVYESKRKGGNILNPKFKPTRQQPHFRTNDCNANFGL